MNTEFTPKQLTEFAQIKHFIKTNTKTVCDWGEKLDRIKVCEYWRMDGAASFKEWCEDNVPIPWKSITWALRKERSQLARHAGEDIKQANVTTKQVNHPEQTPAGNTTSHTHKPDSSQSKKDIPRDDFGVPIPDGCLPIWNRRQEIKDLVDEVQRIKLLIEHKRQEEDPLFAKVSQFAIERADQLYGYLKKAVPETVCGTCKGHPELKQGVCTPCQSTGLQSLIQYKEKTPIEEQAIRAKVYGTKGLPAKVP